MLYTESEMIYQSWRAFGGGDEVRAGAVAELLPGATCGSCAHGNITCRIFCRLRVGRHAALSMQPCVNEEPEPYESSHALNVVCPRRAASGTEAAVAEGCCCDAGHPGRESDRVGRPGGRLAQRGQPGGGRRRRGSLSHSGFIVQPALYAWSKPNKAELRCSSCDCYDICVVSHHIHRDCWLAVVY